ncbi:MAG: PH domain-containing protein [Chitinophagaceae bacterium]|nr:PH domain-containing protein [Chitinophagaceae bacterium]
MRTVLKKDEKVLVVIHQHWLKLATPIAAWLLVSVLLIWFLHNTGLLIALVAALFPLYEYINWKHNLWAVTNLRVIDESGFFSRYSKESPLDKINNVEYNQSLTGRLLGYGTVDIQTAAEMGETTYELINNPKLLKDTITHAQEEYKKSAITNQAQLLAQAIAKNNSSPSQQMIADELHKLFELLQKGAITQQEYDTQKNKLMNS